MWFTATATQSVHSACLQKKVSEQCRKVGSQVLSLHNSNSIPGVIRVIKVWQERQTRQADYQNLSGEMCFYITDSWSDCKEYSILG